MIPLIPPALLSSLPFLDYYFIIDSLTDSDSQINWKLELTSTPHPLEDQTKKLKELPLKQNTKQTQN